MPKMKMTAISVRHLQPTAKSIEYFDTGRSHGAGGLGLRVSPKGKKVWFVMYVTGKNDRRYTLGTYPEMSLKGARDKATNTMADVKNGDDPLQKKHDYRKSETFDDLWQAYLRHPDTRKGAESTKKENQRKYEKLLKPALGEMKVTDIKRKHLNAILDGMAEKTPVSANRLHSLLSVLFNRIALDKEWIDSNPMPRKKPLSVETPKDRVLDDSEIKAIWKHLSENQFKRNPPDIFKLILLTGQRPGEVAGMAWSEIDLQSGVWAIPKERTKSKKQAHLVPLSEQAMQIISARQDNKSSFVFPSNHGSKEGYTRHTHKARGKIIRELNMEGWGAHDLRRTARTIMGRLKVKPYIAEKVLGHSAGRIEKTYDRHDYLDDKRIALDKLGREIDRITGAQVEGKVIKLRRSA